MAAASGSVFSETLQEITNAKLEELSKRRVDFERTKGKIISNLNNETRPIERLVLLSRGVKDCYAVNVDRSGKVLVSTPGQSKNLELELELELQNLDRFLAQSRYDPSISAQRMSTWEASLLRHLDMQSLKYQYASLYAQLVTEWLSTEKKSKGAAGPGGNDGDDDLAMMEGFEDVADAMKKDSRREWEKVVFESAGVDEHRLRDYLDRLFGMQGSDKTAKSKALQVFRSNVTAFETQMAAPEQFNATTLRWVAEGLLCSDLLSEEKREVLRDFLNNPIILAEVADVLNMRIAALGSWSWGDSVPLEQRRKISGIWNVLMHEDLLQAIFLHYIGVKWSVFLKGAFRKFHNFYPDNNAERAWKPRLKPMPKGDVKKRGYYLGDESLSGSVQSVRSDIYRAHYFMAKLMDVDTQQSQSLAGEEEAEYHAAPQSAGPDGQQPTDPRALQSYQMQLILLEQQNKKRMMMARQDRPTPVQQPMYQSAPAGRNDNLHQPKRKRKATFVNYSANQPDAGDDAGQWQYPNTSKKPMEDKQRLLRLLSTEIAINTRLYGEATAFHSMFEGWNSLLPHETVLTVLRFFGFSPRWVNFFTNFLRAPLKFLDEEASVPARTRRRGTPASHVLSDIFGETIFFCLDFAVNQSTDGNVLFRLFDDFWFWSRDQSVAVTAWKTVTEFVDATGTYISPSKTGTVRISRDPSVSLDIDRTLPQGDIRWGFLKLSTTTGKFEIDQDMVYKHIVDLRKQLGDKRKSIISFIQAWNTYAATFFTANFGKPAHCFGRDHVDQMLATHQRIQRQIFSGPSSLLTLSEGNKDEESAADIDNVVDYLKRLMRDRFGVSDIPDAYLFFPVELGGLDLRSPFISILQNRDAVLRDPTEVLDKFLEAERDCYLARKADFEEDRVDRQDLLYPTWQPADERERDAFMGFDEFVRYREDVSYGFDHNLTCVYRQLLEVPSDAGVAKPSARLASGINALAGQQNSGAAGRGIRSDWHNMESYWRWVAQLYGPEAMDRFGGLNIVEPRLLPMGMVSIFRDKRVEWQG